MIFINFNGVNDESFIYPISFLEFLPSKIKGQCASKILIASWIAKISASFESFASIGPENGALPKRHYAADPFSPLLHLD